MASASPAAKRALWRGLGVGALTVLWAGAACTTAPGGTLVALPPPDDWPARLAADLAARERMLRTSPESPLPAAERDRFRGLAWFPPDPARYYVGTVEAYATPENFEIPTTAGAKRPCARVGQVSFAIDGRLHALQVYRLLDAPPGEDLFLPFADATAGQETYPAGRYLDLVGPQGGPFVVDFNAAYNPSCAYGDPARFACPVTPAENRLPVAIAAGERGWTRPGASAP